MSGSYIPGEVLACAITAVVVLVVFYRRRNPATNVLPLPPGPSKRFIFGNMLDMPVEQEWLTYERWHKTYGDVVHLRVGGQDIIILNTHEAAFELLERRSSQYSDRPDFIMLNEFAGFTWDPVGMPYGTEWRKHRALLHKMFHPAACENYVETQMRHAHALLGRIARHETDDPMVFVKHSVGAMIMELTYGLQIKWQDDPWISLCDEAIEIFSQVMVPGAFAVDSIPILRYVPEWAPGAGWKRKAKEWKKTVTRLADAPFEHVKTSMASSTINRPSLVSQVLTENTSTEEEYLLRNVAAVVYAAGTDSTSSILHIFILAMVLHPAAQRAAQSELDTLGRLPTLSDRSRLPYVNALLKEVFRWHPLQPLNNGHVVTRDDEFGGYRIPKGASVHANNWAMFRDQSVYGNDVYDFRPERFLGADPPRDPTFLFGFGRRVCPGRFLASNTIFLFASCILAVFDIKPCAGTIAEARFKSGLLSAPEPFKCRIRPRSVQAAQLIIQTSDIE